MKEEYDFREGERGRFYRPNAVLMPPIHLDPDIASSLTAHAEARGVTLNELVNALLRKDIETIGKGEPDSPP